MYIMRIIRVAVILFVLIGSINTSSAQDYSTKNKKAIKIYEAAIQEYNLLYYDEACASLKSSIDKDPNFIEAHILLSQVYNELGQLDNSIESLENAVAINPNFFPNSFYFLGEMYLNKGDYVKARHRFITMLEYNPKDNMILSRSELGIMCCDFAVVALQNPVDFDPINLGPNINTEQPEYFPCLTADNETILFTRLVKEKLAQSGIQEDFFTSTKINGEWIKSIEVNNVNTILNEGAPTLSPDGQILIFTACEFDGSYGTGRNGKGSCDLFYSSKIGVQWSPPQNLGEKVNTYYWESQPSFSADGRTLYFVRGKYTKNGIAQQDIFVSKLNNSGEWEKASKIKGYVNTDFEEESVMIHPDGKTLYFSSNGHPGMGGMDIFMSKLQDNGEWGKPTNLGYPINTFKNENSVLVAADGEVAYFSSDRDGGFGDMDIYSFILPTAVRADKVTYMKGIVSDANSFKKLEAKFELIDLETGEMVIENYSNPKSGEFLICLPSNRDFALNVSKKGYLFYSDNFSLKGYDSTEPYKKEIELNKLRPGASVILKNVFFATNDYNLDKRSHIELDKLVTMMRMNPIFKCEIGGHTDNIGSDVDNQKLSQKRAESVVTYLVSQSISKDRLTSIGYGEKVPVESNDTEEGRALNRRTEFKIKE